MALKTPEERYQEWLTRLEVPIEETVTIERFQTWLEEQIEYTDARRDALWEAVGTRWEVLAESGIRPVIVVYPWGREVRYGVLGHPGLWGYEGMQQWIGQEI